MTSDHPYVELPGRAFWKTAVADVDPARIDLGWRPKAPIDRGTRIVTVGSCFAQHISRALQNHGFRWLDSEPAPSDLPAAEHSQHGYGVFSFRTGNVYTAGLLRQWIDWAANPASQSREHWLDGGRVFDPFRPALTSHGFATPEEMLAAREKTLGAILAAVREADLFIFTLGLTETWRHRDGALYPMCPGTVRGTFSADSHEFHNYDEQEVRRDLDHAFDALLAINPRLRFLLTVSPVPLTATASGQHVLTATTYSKSVLRSAAGYLARTRADTDYFPSYELIATSPFKGRFYESNLRSVTAEGVAFVMAQFLRAIDGEAKATALARESRAPSPTDAAAPPSPSASRAPADAARGGAAAFKSAEEVCDEIILDTWSPKTFAAAGDLPNLLLIGDSHIGKLSAALDAQGIGYAGGGIMDSADWFEGRFDLRTDRRAFDLTVPEAQARWDHVCAGYLAQLDLRAPGANVCITNVGANTITPSVSGLLPQFLTAIYGQVANRIDGNIIYAYVQRFRVKQLMLVRTLVDLGFNVIWVTDPPLQTKNPDVHRLIDSVLEELFAQTGAHVLNARNWVTTLGVPPASFHRPEMDIGNDAAFADHHHGTDEYYRLLSQEILRRYSIEPRRANAASA